jgi:hypothetical protein
MSWPIVSSMWLFPFTGRQRRYSLFAARYTLRVDSSEASGSRSPKMMAMGISMRPNPRLKSKPVR